MRYLIALPCLDMMYTRFVAHLVCIGRLGPDDYIEMFFSQNSMVWDSRNKIAAKAIREGFDRVLWLDSDMVFPTDILQRLAKHCDDGKEIISGLYFTRKLPVEPVIYSDLSMNPPRSKSYRDYPKNSIFEIAGCGFGGLMTTTQALADIAAVYGNPFDPLPNMGEDFSFCARAASLGKKIYCDSSIKMKHISQYEIGESDFEKIKETESAAG